MQRVLLTALIVGCALTFGGLAIAQAAQHSVVANHSLASERYDSLGGEIIDVA